jgi:xanthine dehydrogenase accessory factor
VNAWIGTLAELMRAGTRVVLVSVVATRGSAPRAPGARMIVAADGSHGSIGGGRLEQRATEIAHALLSTGDPAPRLERVALGASLGQCCGGVVHLLFEPVDATRQPWVERAAALAGAGRAWGRSLRFGCDRAADVQVFDADSLEHVLTDPVHVEQARRLLIGGTDDAVLLTGLAPSESLRGAADDGMTMVLDASPPPALRVVLFGAGHVGRALAEVLGRLPIRVRWVDSRAEEFPATVGTNIEVCCTDTPEAEVRRAPADTLFLVLTHSHALDFELVRQILGRDDFRLCGLLGSRAKRARFVQRLRARGLAEHAIARLHCPLGLSGVPGKEPEVIAIAIAAALLQLRAATPAAPPARRALA